MELDFSEVRRTVWSVKDRVWFFKKMRSLLTEIDDLDAKEIESQLVDPELTYLEVAAYLPPNSGEDPDAILVFEGEDVYWDVINPSSFARVTKTVERLTYPTAKHVATRRLTQEDWLARLMALTPV